MRRREWNSLSVGDLVTVHDHGRLGALDDGVVVSVIQQRDSHDVLIRLRQGPMVYPRRLAVHLTAATRDYCWRCDDVRAPAQRQVNR
jgi:hypothetical protein